MQSAILMLFSLLADIPTTSVQAVTPRSGTKASGYLCACAPDRVHRGAARDHLAAAMLPLNIITALSLKSAKSSNTTASPTSLSWRILRARALS